MIKLVLAIQLSVLLSWAQPGPRSKEMLTELVKTRLEKMSLGKLTYIIHQFPDSSGTSFIIKLKKPATLLGMVVPDGTLVEISPTLEDQSSKIAKKDKDQITAMRVEKGVLPKFQGFECTSVGINNGNLCSCITKESLNIGNYTIPSQSTIFFDPAKKKGAVAHPAVLVTISSPVMVDGKPTVIEKLPLIITEKGLIKKGAVEYSKELDPSPPGDI